MTLKKKEFKITNFSTLYYRKRNCIKNLPLVSPIKKPFETRLTKFDAFLMVNILCSFISPDDPKAIYTLAKYKILSFACNRNITPLLKKPFDLSPLVLFYKQMFPDYSVEELHFKIWQEYQRNKILIDNPAFKAALQATHTQKNTQDPQPTDISASSNSKE